MYTLSYQVMLPPEVLGRRIRFFRNRAGISQFDLEIALDASAGMISRIESGKVNPTKETITKIAGELSINSRELDYLIGVTAVPAIQAEIDKALEEVSVYFGRRDVFAYLIDQRRRFIEISRGFSQLLKIEYSYKRHLIGKTIIQVLIDENLKIRDIIDPNSYEELLYAQLAYYHTDTSYMFDDTSYLDTLKDIRADRLASRMWEKINNNNEKRYLPYEKRLVNFKVCSLSILMSYTREPLLKNPRFEIIEYMPMRKLHRLLIKAA